MSHGLRPRQTKAIEDVRAAYRAGLNDVIISSPIIRSHSLAAVFRVSPWCVSAGTRRSANMRKHERHTEGFLFEVVMLKIADFVGKSFGRLTVVEFHHSNVRTFWLCKCDCGNEKVVSGTSILAGRTKSCGCLQKEAVIQNAKLATKAKSLPYPHARRLCNLFEDMRKRCLNPKTRGYENYGGRGITICDEWIENRRSFYAWATNAGYAPGLEIERVDVNGNYSPENCRFIIRSDQYHNTRRNVFIEWQGKRQTATQWANELGLSPKLIQKRIRSGWSAEMALFKQVAA